jgi:altronate dehydratase
VIDYADLMTAGGFYFMDSPGNDLESVTGQVASGCNMIFFVTGNGSITNFPFVPTIKIVTTSRRYELLSKDMDVNAGTYLDGTAMHDIGAQTLDLCVAVASGRQTVGEMAGHAQVQIWRDWRQTGAVNVMDIRPPHRDGLPLPLAETFTLPDVQMPFYQTPNGPASDQIGLILPTSLCAGQIARLTANQMNIPGVTRIIALTHTEGCGSPTAPEYMDTMLGYMQHPMVARCLLMEHGCEITHNGYLQNRMRDAELDPGDFGWASIQLEGGIDAVSRNNSTARHPSNWRDLARHASGW